MFILKRFGSVLTNLKFCAETLWQEESLKPSWRFWWTWNTALVLGLSVAVLFMLQAASTDLERFFKTAIPSFEVEIESGYLRTTLPDPKILATDHEVIVLDTKQAAYTFEILSSYDYGLFITEDRLLLKSPSSNSNFVFKFASFSDQSWTKEKILLAWADKKMSILFVATVIIAIIFWTLMSGLTLFLCLFLASLIWGIGRIFRLNPWSFSKNFGLWLHYSVLFNFLQVAFIFFGVMPFFALFITLVLVAVNLFFLIKTIRAIT